MLVEARIFMKYSNLIESFTLIHSFHADLLFYIDCGEQNLSALKNSTITYIMLYEKRTHAPVISGACVRYRYAPGNQLSLSNQEHATSMYM